MIYFDNAATGGFKINAVLEAVNNTVKYLSANPGRSGHRLSIAGARTVYSCREALSEMFGANPERVVFTKNCTEALNIAILGSVKKGGHVICSTFEHNSVLRPLHTLEKRGEIELDVVSPTKTVPLDKAVESKIKDNTYLIVLNSVSNVTGEELPVHKIGKIAREHNLLFIVDGAQGGGHIPISLAGDNISCLALAGHKGLGGIMGSGVLILSDNIDIEPIIYGGTGNESFNMFQPKGYPERLEAGTVNLPAIAGLQEGVRYVKSNLTYFGEHLFSNTEKLIEELSNIKNIKVFSAPNRSGIVAFSLSNLPSAEVADILNSDFDVAVRGGLHCAPLTHKYLGTTDGGLVRASLSVQNSSREINYFIKSLCKISKY